MFVIVLFDSGGETEISIYNVYKCIIHTLHTLALSIPLSLHRTLRTKYISAAYLCIIKSISGLLIDTITLYASRIVHFVIVQ